MAALSPALMAGLPGKSAIVWVGPPLLARGPSRGLIGAAVVPTRSPLLPFVRPLLLSLLPTRLCPCEVIGPTRSGPSPEPAVFSATIVFLRQITAVTELL